MVDEDKRMQLKAKRPAQELTPSPPSPTVSEHADRKHKKRLQQGKEVGATETTPLVSDGAAPSPAGAERAAAVSPVAPHSDGESTATDDEGAAKDRKRPAASHPPDRSRDLGEALASVWEAGRRASHRLMSPLFARGGSFEADYDLDEEEGGSKRNRLAQTAAAASIRSMGQHFLDAKRKMKRSPWILSLLVCFSCLGIFSAGLFGLVTFILLLHPVKVIWKLYEVFFAVLTFVTEISRYLSILGSRKLLYRWMPFLELNVGRGCLQILTAGLALTSTFSLGEGVPAIILIVTGISNIVWGVRATLKVRELFGKLKETVAAEQLNQRKRQAATGGSMEDLEAAPLEESALETAQGRVHANLRLMQKKFAALDLNNDGRLSREELSLGCASLNLTLSDDDIDMIFQLLDPRKKGYITVEAFESWWYSEQGVTAFLV